MRPLRLRMYGVGPYAREVDIDFARLNEDGLFLITGATGAGKTSIFDGITYALYGETNFKDDEKKNGIICDYLEEDEHRNTYVEFTFEVDSTEYTVKRMPAHYRYKKNGERNKNKEGEKFEIEATPPRKIPGKKEDRDKYVREEILKVDASQFKKLIMLPQGAFSEFIRSNSKAKKETLEKIFDTAIYEKISDRLRIKVKELSVGIVKERDKAFAKLETLSIENIRWKELLQERILSFDELDTLMKDSQESLTKLNEEIKAEIEKIDINGIVAELTKGETHNKGVRELAAAKEILAELEKRARDIDGKREELKRYNRAKNIKVEYATRERKNKEYLAKEIKYKQSVEALEEYRLKNNPLIDELPSVKSTLEGVKERVNTLENLKEDVKNYKDLVKKVAIDKEELETLEKVKLPENTEAEEEVLNQGKELQERVKLIKIALEKATELRLERGELENRKGILQGIAREYKRAAEDEGNLRKMEVRLRELEEDELASLKVYNVQSNLWFQDRAYSLSKELEEGKPCLVCGSLDHPEVAKKPEGVPTEDELAGYKKTYEADSSKKSLHKGKMDEAARSLDEKKAELIKILSGAGLKDGHEELEELLIKNRDRVKEIDTTLEGLPKREDLVKTEDEAGVNLKKLEEVKEKKQKMETSIAVLKRDIAAGEKECMRVGENLQVKKIDIEGFEEGYKKTVEERDQLEERVAETEKIKVTRTHMETTLGSEEKVVEELKKSAKESERIFREKLKEEKFEGEGEYLEADAIRGRETDEEIREYEGEKIRVDAVIEGKKEYEGKQVTDLGEIAEKKRLSDIRVGELGNEIAKNTSERSNLEKRRDELKVTEQKIGKEEGVLRVYKKLSDISEGKYGDKKNNITFQNYVLGVYFEEVLDRANERFAKMTGNQYEMLLHRKEKSGKGEAGLDINVFDSHTGRERSIKTLSGGETFKASMALALGLSDVVQGQSGGIRLDSVFIDEGFGTLDDESLSAAMDILLELKSSGRIVGIISHVNELKQSITSQIRVEKTTRGSTVEVVR